MSGEAEATYSRAERLDVLLRIFGSQHLTADDALAFVDRDEFYAISDVTDADQELANACLELEEELQDREWAAVERLLTSGMFGGQEAEAKLDAAVARGEIGRIAQDIIDLMDLGLCYWAD
jgi:hypothetical protein